VRVRPDRCQPTRSVMASAGIAVRLRCASVLSGLIESMATARSPSRFVRMGTLASSLTRQPMLTALFLSLSTELGSIRNSWMAQIATVQHSTWACQPAVRAVCGSPDPARAVRGSPDPALPSDRRSPLFDCRHRSTQAAVGLALDVSSAPPVHSGVGET
jgi:hypothetical protein